VGAQVLERVPEQQARQTTTIAAAEEVAAEEDRRTTTIAAAEEVADPSILAQ
jgi:hypothetical protein